MIPMLYLKIGIAVLVVAGAYYKGYADEHERFLKFQAEVSAVGKAQELENQNAVKRAELISEGVKDEYEVRIAAVRSHYSNNTRRVQQCGSGGSNLPPVPQPTGVVNGGADDPALIGLCAAETAKLVALQKWISKQQEVSKNGNQ